MSWYKVKLSSHLTADTIKGRHKERGYEFAAFGQVSPVHGPLGLAST